MSLTPSLLSQFVAVLIQNRLSLFLVGIFTIVPAGWVSRSLQLDQSIESLYALDDPHLQDFQQSRKFFGGDEFIILLPGQNETGATAVARNVLDTIAKPIVVKGERLGVGASIGIAIFPQHGDSEQELIRNADQAMYKAKRHHLGYHLCDSDAAPQD